MPKETVTNPEMLHQVASDMNNTQVAQSNFVNPGTPANPLVTQKDLPSAEVSTTGSSTLRSNLIK